MNTNETALLDPFEVSTPDETAELSALARALELAEGFRLIFVRCNQIPQRERLMEEVRSRLPKLKIQTLFFCEPIQHLLDSIQAKLTTPLPDAVFVSGLEFSPPAAVEASAAPLIASLNAARSSLAQLLPGPLVLWVPEYVLAAIAQGAPDFFSIRSSVYFFAAAPIAMTRLATTPLQRNYDEAANLPLTEKYPSLAATIKSLSASEALPESQRDYSKEAKLNAGIGYLLLPLSELKEAQKYYERSLHLFGELNDQKGVASSLDQIGQVQWRRRNYERALEYYEQSLKIKEELGDKIGVASLLHQIGQMQQERGYYGAALGYYERSLKIKEELGDKIGVASLLHQIGQMQQERGYYGAALGYYERSLKIREKLRYVADVARSLHQIGQMQQERGYYGAALGYYERSLKIREKLGDVEGVASSQANIGMLLTETGQFAEALGLLLYALTVFKQSRSSNAKIVAEMLQELRREWDGFDAAWRDATGEDAPGRLLQDEGTKA